MKKYMKSVLLGGILLITNQIYAQKLPPSFVFQQVTNLAFPTGMAWAPDGRLFLSEQEGNVKVFKGGKKQPGNFVTLDSVYSAKEKGLVGIAFDPNFNTNGYIYFYYTCDLTGNSVGNRALVGSPVRNKIVRYTANGDKAIPGSKKTILDLDIIPDFIVLPNHDGGSMHFGTDGKLYVATGENTLWCPSECFDTFSTECNCPNDGQNHFANKQTFWSQDLFNFHGKILRINADGTAPTDNPFYNSTATTSDVKKYIYVLGVRNPFTMHFRPGTNDLYFNDVGDSGTGAREEINMVNSASGKNFGWNVSAGNNNNALYQDPIFSYNHRRINDANAFPPGTTTVGCAITGGVFYQPAVSNWPNQYMNKYFFMDLCDGWINTLDIDNGNTKANFATNVYTVGTGGSSGGFGGICLETGPDGNMYMLARSQVSSVSGLYQISYQPITVSGITMTGGNTLNTPTTLAFEAGIQPANASDALVLWDVQPSRFASISSTGINGNNAILTPIQDGVVTVTATSSGDYTKKQTIIVYISSFNPLQSLNITTSGVFAITSLSGTLQLGMAFNPSNFAIKNINWSVLEVSSLVNVIVNSNGLVNSIGLNGTATVIGISPTNPNIKPSQIVITLTGQNPLISINITTPSSFTITTDNGSLQLGCEYLPLDFTGNKSITWSVSNTSSNVLASINNAGLLSTNGGNGTVTILGTSVANPSISSIKVVTISGQTIPATSISIMPQNGIISTSVNGIITFDATVLPANALPAPTITWSVITGTGKGSVNSSGVFTALSMGVVTVVAQVNASVKTTFVISVTSTISYLPSKTAIITSKYNEIKLYPVPNNGEFMIESLKLIPQTTMSITNIEGETIFTTPLTNFIGVRKISVPNLAPGIYRVSFSLENGSSHFRMLVE